MPQPALLQEVIDVVRAGLTQPKAVWQLSIIAVGIVTGLLLARYLRARTEARAATIGQPSGLRTDVLRFSMGGVRRLAFPVGAFVAILLIVLVLRATGESARLGNGHLLQLALTLLAAMAGIRLVVYILRRSLPDAKWLVAAERWIAAVVWVGVALHLIGVLNDVVAELEAVVIPVGRTPISLFDMLVGVVSVVVTVLGALWVGSLIETRLMGAQALTANSRVVLVRFIKSLLMVLAVLFALASVGIDLTVLSVFGGALGVGLGLGLQRIASNYVSGFIILLERSLSIGDRITVDKYHGQVTRINTRYTVIDLLNGTETILPNEMLVANPVVNHSLRIPRVKATLRVTVAYGVDVERALALLVQCAAAQSGVLTNPAPGAAVTALGPDGVELELGFWVADVASGGLRSDVAREVLRTFAAERIDIALPQRDLRLVSVPADLAGFAGAPAARADAGKPADDPA